MDSQQCFCFFRQRIPLCPVIGELVVVPDDDEVSVLELLQSCTDSVRLEVREQFTECLHAVVSPIPAVVEALFILVGSIVFYPMGDVL